MIYHVIKVVIKIQWLPSCKKMTSICSFVDERFKLDFNMHTTWLVSNSLFDNFLTETNGVMLDSPRQGMIMDSPRQGIIMDSPRQVVIMDSPRQVIIMD